MNDSRRTVRQMVDEANAHVRTIDYEEAVLLHACDDVLFIDVRDIRELGKTGRISKARHVPRGMLEFWIDPDSPYHKPFLSEDKTFVFYCASGWRSALAAQTAQEMGLEKVAHLAGGFSAWAKAGGPVEGPSSSNS